MVIMSAKVAADLTVKSVKQVCVSAPLKPGWQWFTAASGASAGGLSALTGLGGAVVFVPACSHLGMTAKKIVGTTVVAVTCATTAGSIAYTQNNVTDIPAAIAIGIVGAATTPLGQMIAKGISGKMLRKCCGGALLACAPTAFMTKKKTRGGGGEGEGEGEEAATPTSETRPGGVAALALVGKAEQLVAKGGILAYLNRANNQPPPPSSSSAGGTGGGNDKVGSSRSGVDGADTPRISSPKEITAGAGAAVIIPSGTEATATTGQSGSAIQNIKEQFQERLDRNGGDVYQALWAEREYLLLGLAVGMLQAWASLCAPVFAPLRRELIIGHPGVPYV